MYFSCKALGNRCITSAKHMMTAANKVSGIIQTYLPITEMFALCHGPLALEICMSSNPFLPIL